MSKSSLQTDSPGDPRNYCPNAAKAAPPPASVAAAVAVLAAAWLAAGSVGLWGTELLRVLSFTALVTATILITPSKGRLAILLSIAAFMLVLPVVLAVHAVPGYYVLFVVAVAGVLADSQGGLPRRALSITAWATAAMAIFYVSCSCMPAFWQLSDACGRALGNLTGLLSGRPLWLGSSFGGLAFLVGMIAFYAAWLCYTPRPRLRRAVYAAAAIIAVQFGYLLILSQAENLVAALPELPPPPSADPTEYVPPTWSPAAALHGFVPWGLPLLAMIGQLCVAAVMLRWTDWPSAEKRSTAAASADTGPGRWLGVYLSVALLAVAAAAALVFSPCRSNLSGKKIVAYADSDVWSVPEHGKEDLLAADGYGMLPAFVASLGGEFYRSKSLSAADLDAADVLILIDLQEPLDENALRRVHDFVTRGGSLLLIAGPASRSNHDRCASDEILRPTGMSVRFDMAEPATPHWRHACRTLAHPATVGVDPRRNQFGLNLGSSIGSISPDRIASTGCPLIVGRWGWCEPGSDMIASGAGNYNEGEKLGDVVLAAEATLGRGTVVVLGDTTGPSNIGLVYTHPFAGRLLGYLANGGLNPQSHWRQGLATVLLVVLFCLVIGCRGATANEKTRMQRLAVAAATLAIAMATFSAISRIMSCVVPDGRLAGARAIAYIDAEHFGIADDDHWTPRGVGGFAVTLMRNGYMPLLLYDTDERRLQGANMLAVIGPCKEFTKSQRRDISHFVDRGGLLVCAVGAEQSAAGQGLLDDFDFVVPHSPVAAGDTSPEPAPIGRYPDDFGRAFLPYLNAKDYGRGDYLAHVWVHQPWPVKCNADEGVQDTLIYVHNRPLAVARHRGDGCAVVIGDSYFMLNENHGYVYGRPTEGTTENLDFWRWFFTRASDRSEWFPPDRSSRREKTEATDSVDEQKPAEVNQAAPLNRNDQELPELNLPLNPLRADEVVR